MFTSEKFKVTIKSILPGTNIFFIPGFATRSDISKFILWHTYEICLHGGQWTFKAQSMDARPFESTYFIDEDCEINVHQKIDIINQSNSSPQAPLVFVQALEEYFTQRGDEHFVKKYPQKGVHSNLESRLVMVIKDLAIIKMFDDHIQVVTNTLHNTMIEWVDPNMFDKLEMYLKM